MEADYFDQISKIRHIVSVQVKHNNEDDDGDKYLSQPEYALEAIDSVLEGQETGIVRQFMEAEA